MSLITELWNKALDFMNAALERFQRWSLERGDGERIGEAESSEES